MQQVMKAPAAFTFVALLGVITSASARISDTPAQLKERYGEPIAEFVDKDGYGLRIYRTAQFKEIRVTFAAGKSQMEKYRATEAAVDQEALFVALREENPGAVCFERSDGRLEISMDELESELKFVRSTGRPSTYVGVLQIKKMPDRNSPGVSRNKDWVVEIVLNGVDPGLDFLPTGVKCKVTVLDQDSDDLRTPMAWIGKREHLDWEDAIDDAHDRLQTMLKVEGNGTTLFDRSICGLHHIPMKLREVPIEYGMLAQSTIEAYCDPKFPHFREYAAGGCLVGEKKTTRIYICPACVAACKEYSKAHPEPEKALGDSAQ
jgi:hypothetical protein